MKGRMSLGEKSEHVLRFIIGARNPRVAAELRRYGFSEGDLREGWQLLHEAAGISRPVAGRPTETDATVATLDDWENEWFPVVRAVLERHHPHLSELIFDNLSQTSGPGVALSVATLLERIEQMALGAEPYGAEGVIARQKLESRGFSDTVIASAKDLRDALGRLASIEVPDRDQKTAFDRAEGALWAWYAEWRRLARVAITNRSLLRQLGLSARGERTGGSEGGPETADDASVTEATGDLATEPTAPAARPLPMPLGDEGQGQAVP